MNILLGVGNIMNGDDGVGPYIAKKFRKEGWLCIDSGTAPENFTAIIKKKRPTTLIIVDAVDMGLPAGEVRRITKQTISKAYFSTHSIPLSFFIEYVEPYCGEVILIGIQIKQHNANLKLSKEVKESADALIKILEHENIGRINQL